MLRYPRPHRLESVAYTCDHTGAIGHVDGIGWMMLPVFKSLTGAKWIISNGGSGAAAMSLVFGSVLL